MKRASIAQVKHIKVGTVIYMVNTLGVVRGVVTSVEVNEGFYRPIISVEVKWDKRNRGWMADSFCLGDRGVRPNNYDTRVSQVFLNRRAAERARKAWGGRWPNFLEGNPVTGESVKVHDKPGFIDGVRIEGDYIL